ncbi:hypothetical protein ACFOZ0_08875 [Streptomyces yaanensis]|uniref:Uncharacterized protein n=1 Tax=Streptomyces yaanensis TaxID=1142239 RepID=A0ABV7SA02_9ACTN|nr:hypothetical protein [Streptomyces sp. CGMCC 4.7035]WNC02862.1 hypothetical protein Q2K21_35135 [Streptomyces sp. CGMCC 4.7035]
METARVFFGLAAPVVVSWERRWFTTRPGRSILFTVAYGTYAIAPYVDELKPWAALGVAFLLSLGAILLLRSHVTPSLGFSITTPLSMGAVTATKRLGAAAVGLAALAGLRIGWATASKLGTDLLLSDKLAVMSSSLLIAVFGGGTLAQAITAPVVKEIYNLPTGPNRDSAIALLDSGGRSIGLIERGLLFTFLAAGQPEAAALVLAAKALARAPVDHVNHASKYFLIGTLASVIASMAMSMAARTAVGLPVF